MPYADPTDPRIHEKERRAHIKRRYGITVADYDAMLDAQGGVCAICRRACPTGRRLAVDHNHETGEIRGLLCFKCNAGIGKLNDDPKLLLAALEYLTGGIFAVCSTEVV